MKLIKEFENNEKRYLQVSHYFLILLIITFIWFIIELTRFTINLLESNILDLTSLLLIMPLFLIIAVSGIMCVFQSQNYKDNIQILKAINNH